MKIIQKLVLVAALAKISSVSAGFITASEEKKVNLEAKMILNLDKLLQKTINKKDVLKFKEIITYLKQDSLLFNKPTKEETEEYKSLIVNQLKKEKKDYKAHRTNAEVIKITALSSASVISATLSLTTFICFIRDIHNGNRHGILKLAELIFPWIGVPLSIKFAKDSYDLLKRSNLKSNLKNLKIMKSEFENYIRYCQVEDAKTAQSIK